MCEKEILFENVSISNNPQLYVGATYVCIYIHTTLLWKDCGEIAHVYLNKCCTIHTVNNRNQQLFSVTISMLFFIDANDLANHSLSHSAQLSNFLLMVDHSFLESHEWVTYFLLFLFYSETNWSCWSNYAFSIAVLWWRIQCKNHTNFFDIIISDRCLRLTIILCDIFNYCSNIDEEY